MRRPELLIVLGPTGTGKSELAAALAERLDGEVIGCDALQVYRGFDVGTAKPPPALLARVPHHLIDHVEPTTDYSLALYVRHATHAVDDVLTRDRLPVVVGGTGLYLRALLLGFVEAPARQPALRERLRGLATRHGSRALHTWLARLDPDSAARIGPGDTQRLVRALELALVGESTWSERLRGAGAWDEDPRPRYRAIKIGLDLPREELGARLDARTARFFGEGWVEEVRRLAARVPPQANAFKAIGYREILAALGAGADPSGSLEAVQRSTRRYAKRQRTWFRREQEVLWLDARAPLPELLRQALAYWHVRRG